MEIYNIWTLDVEAETPIFRSPDAKNWLNEKTLMPEKIEGRRRDDRRWDGWMASRLNGHEFRQALGGGDE